MIAIAEPGSYSIRNFISFTDEVYFRLFVRQFEAWWPAPLVMLAIGAAILVLACVGKPRTAATALAIPLAFTALTFHFKLYAELSPVGKFFGWAFLIQIPLLVIWGLLEKSRESFQPNPHSIIGAAIAAFALIGHPLLTLSEDYGWKGAEYFGMAPDPTICLFLGVTLIVARPAWAFLLFPIPLLWSFVTWATLDTFESPTAIILPVVGAIAVAGMVWKVIISRGLPRDPDES